MMLIHDLIQGSEAWLNIRLGIPTTSRFGDIITPTGKASSAQGKYLSKLLAELSTGKSEPFKQTYWMQRGNELEPEAAAWYSQHYDVELKEVGFITSRDMRLGCSPDRLLGTSGLVEIKCPSDTKHLENAQRGSIDPQYIPQVMGQLLMTKRKFCDFVSYHPDMSPVVYRVERDEEYLAKLKEVLDGFLNDMDNAIYALEQRNWKFKINVKPRDIGVEGV